MKSYKSFAAVIALALATTTSQSLFAQGIVTNPPVPRARRAVVRDEVAGQTFADEEATKATADYNAANAAAQEATKELADAMDQRQRDFEQSPELANAKQAVFDADAATSKARDNALTTLKQKPDYKAALSKAASAEHKVDSLRASNALPSQISDAAQMALNADGAVGKIESDTLAADPAYSDAHTRLVAANTTLKNLKSQFNRGLSTDPTVAPLKKAKNKADLAVAEAKGVMDAKVNYVRTYYHEAYRTSLYVNP